MSFRDRLLEIRWTLGRKWFGVWEVRDYYIVQPLASPSSQETRVSRAVVFVLKLEQLAKL